VFIEEGGEFRRAWFWDVLSTSIHIESDGKRAYLVGQRLEVEGHFFPHGEC
jgi:hypothetical protein